MLNIPSDVLIYTKNHFAQCNREVSSSLSSFPASYEEHLDMTLINYWARQPGPVKLPSNWIVQVDVNFMGGGRHYGAWEVADLGVILIFRKRGKVIRSKMAFIQSKKLYASPHKAKPNRIDKYGYGMGNLLTSEEQHLELTREVKYKFTEASRYDAFIVDSEQQQAMSSFQKRYDMKMYYLFYNPLVIPHEIISPHSGLPLDIPNNIVGTRVMPKNSVDIALRSYEKGYKPSYGDIKYMLPLEFTNDHEAGWRLEYFIVDLMMGCKEGVIDDSSNFKSLLQFMNQKSRPMSSSIAITFDDTE